MHVNDFDSHMQALLDIPRFAAIDPGMNGVQVGDSNARVKSLVCAVDACHESVDRAIASDADILFVHHGIYWKTLPALTGRLYTLVKKLMDNNITLYACHLPLDAHPVHGNNAQIALQMDLQNSRPFGNYAGEMIGIQGELPKPIPLKNLQRSFFPKALGVGDFRKRDVQRIGIISGGATRELEQAIAERLDAYITGDVNHLMYHTAKEAGIDFISGGHYATETHGVKSIAEYCSNELKLSGRFVDIPTQL